MHDQSHGHGGFKKKWTSRGVYWQRCGLLRNNLVHHVPSKDSSNQITIFGQHLNVNGGCNAQILGPVRLQLTSQQIFYGHSFENRIVSFCPDS